MKTSVEITLKSLALSGIPEKALPVSRNLLTVEMIWPKVGVPRKSATRQVTMKKGKVDFTTEPWAKRVLFREDIDGHTAFTVSIAEPVTLQKLHRLLQLTAKAALKEGADMIDATLVSYGDIAAAPVDALATMVAERTLRASSFRVYSTTTISLPRGRRRKLSSRSPARSLVSGLEH